MSRGSRPLLYIKGDRDFPLTVTEDERLRLDTAMMCSPKLQVLDQGLD